jgi:hypothetical protein
LVRFTARWKKKEGLMFIARWQFTARFGKTDDCVSILRKWEIDVGQRIGWKSGSTRLVSGFIGSSQSNIEFETRFDNLTDLESAWNDMDRVPHHREYMKMLEPLIEGGTDRWTLYREAEVGGRSA